MTRTPLFRWLASFALAPLAWAVLVFPGLSQLSAHYMTNRMAAYLGLVGGAYQMVLPLNILAAVGGALALRRIAAIGSVGPRLWAVAFVVAFPVVTIGFLVLALASLGSLVAGEPAATSPRSLPLDVLPGLLVTSFLPQTLTTLAIALPFALWIARARPAA
jgi:hypothetical protein